MKTFLLSRFSAEAFSQLSTAANVSEFQMRLEAVGRKKLQGTHLMFVSDDCDWTEEWVQLAVKRCARLTSRERYIRVLFAAGSVRAWDLLSEAPPGTPVDLGAKVQLLSLRPWSDDSLRQWLEDLGIPIGEADRRAIAAASGSWPACLYAMRGLSGQGVEPGDLASELINRSIDLAKSSRVIAMSSAQSPVLKALAEWSDALDPDELEDLIGKENQDLTARVIRWGEALSLIDRDAKGAWRLDPVFAGAIRTAD